MRAILRICLVAVAALALGQPASAQPVRNRLSVAIDSGTGMLQTPARIAFTESCTGVGFNPCLGNNLNPSAAQESCNACVRDTIRSSAACATSWNTSCADAYRVCIQNVTGQAVCSGVMTATSAVATRGDGSVELPGCDLDADAAADDSKIFQAKVAVRSAAVAVPDVEVALWRFAQVVGGGPCASAADCPRAPGGGSAFTCASFAGAARCVFDADLLDGPTTAGFEGQCDMFTHTGSPASFACSACDFQSTYDRAACEMFDLDRVRSGGASPLGGSTVQCYPVADPSHRYITYRGGCTGGDRLVDFPLGTTSNLAAIGTWLDHAQPAPASDVELRANGGSPVAALLRDQRAALLGTLAADPSATCRRYAIALVLDGPDNCEATTASEAAAAALQNLGFTPPGGAAVSGYAVPVHVFAFGVCPASDPNCADIQALDAVAASGGTRSAVRVGTDAELGAALGALAASLDVDTCVDGIFNDGFE